MCIVFVSLVVENVFVAAAVAVALIDAFVVVVVVVVHQLLNHFNRKMTGADSLTVDPLSRACRFQIRPSDLSCRMEGPGSGMPGTSQTRSGRVEKRAKSYIIMGGSKQTGII